MRVATQGGPFAGVDGRVIKRRAHKMLRALGLSDVELSVALVDGVVIRRLNLRYRQKDRPTDVLSFEMRDAEHPELLGDVVISVETAARQAARRRCTVLDEATMLLAHGLLHLLGYDHRTDAQERIMLAKTRELEHAAVQRAR